MTTVIAAYDSEGCIGRCDARCHKAVTDHCECICGGRLHGVGADNALALNTRDFLGEEPESIAKSWCNDQQVTPYRIHVRSEPRLFEAVAR